MSEITISKFIKSNCCDYPVRMISSDLTGETWLYCCNLKCKQHHLACTVSHVPELIGE